MKRLTETEKEKYIQDTILPVFQPMSQYDTYTTLFSTKGNILFISQKSAASLSIEPARCIGMNYQVPSEEYIQSLREKHQLNIDNIREACKTVYDLQMQVIKNQKSASYIDLIPYNGQFYGYLCILTPLFHPNGQPIALLVNSTRYHLFGLHEFVSMQNLDTIPILHSPDTENLNIKLSNRQHEILFLVSNGFSQEHVAQILKVSRGTIAKTISSQICPKFNIDNDSAKLIHLARQIKIHHKIPKSLWNWYIITLTP